MTPQPDLLAIAETIDKATPGPIMSNSAYLTRGDRIPQCEIFTKTGYLFAVCNGANIKEAQARADGIADALNLAPAALRRADAEIKDAKEDLRTAKIEADRIDAEHKREIADFKRDVDRLCLANAEQAATIAAQAAEIEGLRAKLAQSEEDGESLAAALINAARESVNAKIDSGEIRLPEEPN